MGIDREIEHAVKKIVAFDMSGPSKTLSEQEEIISNVKKSISSSVLNFCNIQSLILNQNGKKRLVKKYNDLYSVENILCQCIKQILDRTFKVKYPNRNKTTRTLFNILTTAIQMSDFTIVKFDFKDYFNSISSIYVFEKYLKNGLLNRYEIDLVNNFVNATQYAYAGLCNSYVIAEIVARHFDESLRQVFVSNGMIYYERYIDDGILILNEHLEEYEIREKLKNVLLNIFHDKTIECKVKCKTKKHYIYQQYT